MEIEKEIKRLKDEEKEIEYPAVTKKQSKQQSVNINLWPIIPIILLITAVNYFGGNGKDLNFWTFWWLIFLVKPILMGRGKSWYKAGGSI